MRAHASDTQVESWMLPFSKQLFKFDDNRHPTGFSVCAACSSSSSVNTASCATPSLLQFLLEHGHFWNIDISQV